MIHWRIFGIVALIVFFSFTASAGENDNPLTLQRPMGGEQIVAGTVYDIHYFAPKEVDNMCIETSVDGGATWKEICKCNKPEAQLGLFKWQVPDTISDNCLVRISDVYGSGVTETSFPFSIVEKVSLKVEKADEKLDEIMYPDAGGSD